MIARGDDFVCVEVVKRSFERGEVDGNIGRCCVGWVNVRSLNRLKATRLDVTMSERLT